MEIKDYIIKNLPNLNWNILPQIFEENNVELTEEIERYLKETPGNTNWNVFRGLGNESGPILDTIKLFVTKDPETLGYNFSTEEINYLLNKLQVGTSYKLLVDDYILTGIWTYEKVSTQYSNYDLYKITPNYGDGIQFFQIGIYQSGPGGSIAINGWEENSYHIILEKIEENNN